MTTENNTTIFSITTDDIQCEALRLIKRRLSDKELGLAVKGIDCGLSTGSFIVFKSAIDEAVEYYSKSKRERVY